MCGLSQKYSGDVNQTKPNLISQISNLVRFGLTSPEYFCDNPHIVRHLTRDINHTIPASPEGFNPNFFIMVLIPRETSYYVWVIAEILGRRQIKLNQISPHGTVIWFGLI